MTNIIKFNPANFPAGLLADTHEELTGGVTGSFPIVSIRGKLFRVKAKGQEQIVKNTDGDPVGSIKVVILRGNERLSKIYYEADYEEGSDASPDCFSVDGVKPDRSILAPQHASCDTCKHNVWGSKITPGGAKTKSCADSRRLVVVPTGDMKNEALGGPMLFRVPPTSLNELTAYSGDLKAAGAPSYAVSTRISFDEDASHAKPVFHFDRELTAPEFALAKELREADACGRILQESPVATAEAAAPAAAGAVPDIAPATPPAATSAKAKKGPVTVVDDDDADDDDDEAAAVAAAEAALAAAKKAKAKKAKAKKAADKQAAAVAAVEAAGAEAEASGETFSSTTAEPADGEGVDVDDIVTSLLG